MENIEVNKIETNKTKTTRQRQTALRHSNFFITINSNKSVNKLTQEQQEAEITRFEEVIDKLYNQELRNMITLTSTKTEGSMVGVELMDRIVKAKVEYVVEIGPSKGLIHSHGLFALSHRALNVKINIPKLRDEFLPTELGYYCYLDIKVYSDATASLQEYIQKTSDRHNL